MELFDGISSNGYSLIVSINRLLPYMICVFENRAMIVRIITIIERIVGTIDLAPYRKTVEF